MEIVNIRIKHFETHYKQQDTIPSISRIKRKLKDLEKEYIFVPADKAVNAVIVWRKFYIEVLRNEITNSSTFQAMTSTETQIIDDHVIATAQLKAT